MFLLGFFWCLPVVPDYWGAQLSRLKDLHKMWIIKLNIKTMSETLDDKSKRSERWKNTLSHPMKSWLLNIISPLLWFRSTSYIRHDSTINHHVKKMPDPKIVVREPRNSIRNLLFFWVPKILCLILIGTQKNSRWVSLKIVYPEKPNGSWSLSRF